MRTFHIGGVAQSVKAPEITVRNDGKVVYRDLRTVELSHLDPTSGREIKGYVSSTRPDIYSYSTTTARSLKTMR